MAIVRDGKLFGRYHYAFVIMVCCCLVQAFGMGLILNCGSLFYVPVCTDLGFSRSEISTYMTGYFIGTTLVTPLRASCSRNTTHVSSCLWPSSSCPAPWRR